MEEKEKILDLFFKACFESGYTKIYADVAAVKNMEGTDAAIIRIADWFAGELGEWKDD